MASNALDRAIEKERREVVKKGNERKEAQHAEATGIAGGSAFVGAIAGAIHDRMRGKAPKEPREDGTVPLEVAKLGPVPANLAVGVLGTGVAFLVPKKLRTFRSVMGGTSVGLANAGLYRLVYDHFPESDDKEEDAAQS